jgi:hypothetical protein
VSAPPIDPFPSVNAALADARGLDDQELCDALVEAEKALRRTQAQMAVLTAELQSRVAASGCRVSGASEELALLLAVSPRSADRRMDLAVMLCEREVVWAALHDGRIDTAKAQVILDVLQDVPDPRREELELIAIEYGEERTAHQLRKRLLALTVEKDPDEVLRKEALDRREVWVRPAAHGMAEIGGYVSAEQAEIFIGALEKMAADPHCPDPYGQGDNRSKPQRMADALVGLLSDRVKVEVCVDVVISADHLAGDNDWTPESKRLGPIGSEIARDLCASPDARWRRLITDPISGELVAMDTSAYRIPRHLREAIKARDVSCRFPGCHSRAEFFDCDHIVPHPEGETCSANLAGLCRRHHRTKTFSTWKVERDPLAPRHELVWTSPLGRRYRTASHRYARNE